MMADREKIKSGLACCRTMLHNLKASDCAKCPYNNGKPGENQNQVYCMANLVDDTLALMEEQDA